MSGVNSKLLNELHLQNCANGVKSTILRGKELLWPHVIEPELFQSVQAFWYLHRKKLG